MFNINHLIETGGLLLIGGIVFAESGLLVGFFLPGDTLLFSAGFFAGQGKLPLIWLLLVVILAAIAGYEVGYQIGHKFGKRLFRKEEGIIFRQDYLRRSEIFYEKHGGKTVMLSRFIPVIRTFAPIVAGIGSMSKTRFVSFNILGAVVWTTGVVLLGRWLGRKIPNIDHYLLPVIIAAMLISFGPSLYHIFGDKETRIKILAKLQRKKA
ncbi:MAG TPA: VTT domain-containing protein [Candidatus Saccharimonadales bacterium]|nr:VTT domain-containing protein [Candidatus Saccharimonadales bacterium]